MLATPSHRGSRSERSSQRPRGTPRDHARSSTPPLPPYEPPIAHLNETGHSALITLLRSQGLHRLKTHLQHSGLKLTESAGEVNERLTDARVRHQRQKERARSRTAADNEDEEYAGKYLDLEADPGETAHLTTLEEQVKAVTETLDAHMRRGIDSEVKVDRLTDILTKIETEVEREKGTRPRAKVRRPRRGGNMDVDEGGEEDEEDEEESEYESTPEREARESEFSIRYRLDERLSESHAEWDELSLTERYSKNNSYIGFYRIIHEAKHPGDDIPPLPHASTWFSHLEDPNARTGSQRPASASDCHRATRQRKRGASPADSDDLAIERERISLKCPLTLLPFQNPVTSTKCPHSFEREAIVSMINQSSTTVPGVASAGNAKPRRMRSVKCPVCSAVLTISDLREDPVLVRRVRRAEQALQREREEEEEMRLSGSRRGGRSSRKSGITVASDDDDERDGEYRIDIDSEGGSSRSKVVASQMKIKQERATSTMSRGVSSRPPSSLPGSGSLEDESEIEEAGGGEEEEGEEEDDEEMEDEDDESEESEEDNSTASE